MNCQTVIRVGKARKNMRDPLQICPDSWPLRERWWNRYLRWIWNGGARSAMSMQANSLRTGNCLASSGTVTRTSRKGDVKIDVIKCEGDLSKNIKEYHWYEVVWKDKDYNFQMEKRTTAAKPGFEKYACKCINHCDFEIDVKPLQIEKIRRNAKTRRITYLRGFWLAAECGFEPPAFGLWAPKTVLHPAS